MSNLKDKLLNLQKEQKIVQNFSKIEAHKKKLSEKEIELANTPRPLHWNRSNRMNKNYLSVVACKHKYPGLQTNKDGLGPHYRNEGAFRGVKMAKIKKPDGTEVDNIKLSPDGVVLNLKGKDGIYKILQSGNYDIIEATEQEMNILDMIKGI